MIATVLLVSIGLGLVTGWVYAGFPGLSRRTWIALVGLIPGSRREHRWTSKVATPVEN
jgi:hypothetical protein